MASRAVLRCSTTEAIDYATSHREYRDPSTHCTHQRPRRSRSVHCLAIFALYRGRVVAHWSVSDSDFIVFLLPTLLAFGAYLGFLTGMLKRIGPRFGLAVLFTFLSGWASLIVSFNTYGT